MLRTEKCITIKLPTAPVVRLPTVLSRLLGAVSLLAANSLAGVRSWQAEVSTLLQAILPAVQLHVVRLISLHAMNALSASCSRHCKGSAPVVS